MSARRPPDTDHSVSLGSLSRINFVDETAVFKLAHDAAIDDGIDLKLALFSAYAASSNVRVAQSIDGWKRFLLDATQQIVITSSAEN